MKVRPDLIDTEGLHYGEGLFLEGQRFVLAYRHPQGRKADFVKVDLERVRGRVYGT